LADLKTVDALHRVPSDPDTDQPYAYERRKNGSGYCLGGCMTGSNTPENSNNQCVSYWSLNVTLEVHMRLVKNQPGSFSILLSYTI
jgi:hypothetical protein